MTDPTPTAADREAARLALVAPPDAVFVPIGERIARALATARRDADAAGYARGLREAAGLARRVFGHADLHGLRDEMVRAIDRALALASPPTPEPMPPDDIAEQWEDCTGLPDCPGCRVRHPDAPGMCGGFAADTPPTPEPTPRSCNRHTDCDAADRDAKAHGKPLGADHCHDDTCEDCFGD